MIRRWRVNIVELFSTAITWLLSKSSQICSEHSHQNFWTKFLPPFSQFLTFGKTNLENAFFRFFRCRAPKTWCHHIKGRTSVGGALLDTSPSYSCHKAGLFFSLTSFPNVWRHARSPLLYTKLVFENFHANSRCYNRVSKCQNHYKIWPHLDVKAQHNFQTILRIFKKVGNMSKTIW